MGENSKSKTANKGKTLLVSTAHLPPNPPTSLRGYNCQDEVFDEVNSREKVLLLACTNTKANKQVGQVASQCLEHFGAHGYESSWL